MPADPLHVDAWMLVSPEEAARGARDRCAWNDVSCLWVPPEAATLFNERARCEELREKLGDSAIVLPATDGRVVCDAMLDADELEERYADYPVAQFGQKTWRHEISTGETMAGYWDWLADNLQRHADDVLGPSEDGDRVFLRARNAACMCPGM